jgi:chaperonin GroES
MKLIPVGERVLVRLEKAGEERTKSGIYLPKSGEDKKRGVVAAVGFDKEGRTLPLRIGEKVIYGGFSNEEIELEGQTFIMVEFKDIIAKLE